MISTFLSEPLGSHPLTQSLSLCISGYKVLSLLDVPQFDSGSIDQADVYLHITFIKKWDICAGAALLNALGMKQPVAFLRNVKLNSDFPLSEKMLENIL